MALFPALLLMFALSNKLAAGSQLLTHAVDVYPGSAKFLRETIEAFSDLGFGAIVTCIVIVFSAGSWVFAVIERHSIAFGKRFQEHSYMVGHSR